MTSLNDNLLRNAKGEGGASQKATKHDGIREKSTVSALTRYAR